MIRASQLLVFARAQILRVAIFAPFFSSVFCRRGKGTTQSIQESRNKQVQGVLQEEKEERMRLLRKPATPLDRYKKWRLELQWWRGFACSFWAVPLTLMILLLADVVLPALGMITGISLLPLPVSVNKSPLICILTIFDHIISTVYTEAPMFSMWSLGGVVGSALYCGLMLVFLQSAKLTVQGTTMPPGQCTRFSPAWCWQSHFSCLLTLGTLALHSAREHVDVALCEYPATSPHRLHPYLLRGLFRLPAAPQLALPQSRLPVPCLPTPVRVRVPPFPLGNHLVTKR